MDLESRMREKTDLHNQLGNKGYNCIPLRDALTIAREYASTILTRYVNAIVDKDSKSIVAIQPEFEGLTIGETSTETIQQLVDAGCKSISYTSYGLHLFRIFDINIRLDCFNQIPTWNRIKRKHKDKFKLCCIMIDKPERFESQIKWCMENGNNIMLIAPDKWKEQPEKVKEHLTEFIKQHKEITK